MLDKNLQRVKFVPKPAQADYRARRTRRNLIVKARQLGLSTVIQADNFLEAITRTTLSATIAHDDQTTQKLRRMANGFYENLPADIRPPRGLDNATTTTYSQTKSEVTIVTAGSGNAGRGGTYNRLHGSEVAFWKDAAAVMAGIMQGVTADGVIELESTGNGARGWFYERCMEALDPTSKSDWSLRFYAWWWDTGYRIPLEDGETLEPYSDDELRLIVQHKLTPEQIKFRRFKQRELGYLFPQEYAEDPVTCFLTSGAGVFGDFAHVLYIPTQTGPIDGHEYVGGLDWGQSNDATDLTIIDATDYREVFRLNLKKMLWGDMRREVLNACRRWHVEPLVAERNSASSNVEDLQNEFDAAEVKCSIHGFTMTNKKKSDLVVNFHDAIHESGLRLINDPVANNELRNFVSKQTALGVWTYAADGDGHDDTVISRMLANYAVNQRIPEHW